MSDLRIPGSRPTRRRVVTVAAVLAGLLVVGVGGTVVDAAAPTFRPTRIPLVGKTTTICSITRPAGGAVTATERTPWRPGRPQAGRAG